MKIGKYFWGLNEKALKEIPQILKNPFHSKYPHYTFILLSRLDDPKKLFSVIDKKQFIMTWPQIRRYWRKIGETPDFMAWWDTIYNSLLERKGIEKGYGQRMLILQKIGKIIKKARIEKGLNQEQLSRLSGMKQPHISLLEKGGKNVTLETLIRICRALEIKNIPIWFS